MDIVGVIIILGNKIRLRFGMRKKNRRLGEGRKRGRKKGKAQKQGRGTPKLTYGPLGLGLGSLGLGC